MPCGYVGDCRRSSKVNASPIRVNYHATLPLHTSHASHESHFLPNHIILPSALAVIWHLRISTCFLHLASHLPRVFEQPPASCIALSISPHPPIFCRVLPLLRLEHGSDSSHRFLRGI